MEGIDNILNSVGISQPEANPIEERESQNSLSDNEFDDLLSDLGVNLAPTEPEPSSEEYEQDEEELGSDMDIDSTNYVDETEEDLEEEEREPSQMQITEESPSLSSNGQSTEETPENLIPENSGSILVQEATSRFSGTEWYEEVRKKSVILAGLGGIGSWTALNLARLSLFYLYIYDDDNVEEANMSGQFYSRANIDCSKAAVLNTTLCSYAPGTVVRSIVSKFTSSSQPGDIMICGFDSMQARRVFFDSWLSHLMDCEDRSKCLFIDGRLSIDTLQIYCIKGDDDYCITKYASECLFSDEEADAVVCSMKQTTYMACMIGSLITNLFINFVANTLDPVIEYNLPFFTEYDCQQMIFKTKN